MAKRFRFTPGCCCGGAYSCGDSYGSQTIGPTTDMTAYFSAIREVIGDQRDTAYQVLYKRTPTGISCVEQHGNYQRDGSLHPSIVTSDDQYIAATFNNCQPIYCLTSHSFSGIMRPWTGVRYVSAGVGQSTRDRRDWLAAWGVECDFVRSINLFDLGLITAPGANKQMISLAWTLDYTLISFYEQGALGATSQHREVSGPFHGTMTPAPSYPVDFVNIIPWYFNNIYHEYGVDTQFCFGSWYTNSNGNQSLHILDTSTARKIPPATQHFDSIEANIDTSTFNNVEWESPTEDRYSLMRVLQDNIDGRGIVSQAEAAEAAEAIANHGTFLPNNIGHIVGSLDSGYHIQGSYCLFDPIGAHSIGEL